MAGEGVREKRSGESYLYYRHFLVIGHYINRAWASLEDPLDLSKLMILDFYDPFLGDGTLWEMAWSPSLIIFSGNYP